MMKKLKVIISFIFVAIGLLSIIALCNFNQVSAKTNYLTFTDGIAKLGRYPQTMTDEDVTKIESEGKYNSTTGWYEYDNKEYAIIEVKIDTDYRNQIYFNNGDAAKNYENDRKAFLVEDIKWEILSSGDGYVNIIPTRVIDRQKFDINSKKDYLESSIFQFNNVFFLNSFTEDEKQYLKTFDTKNPYYVNLPEESELKNYEDEKYEYPSDYAIASCLSWKESNDHAPYWTKTITTEGDRVKAYWAKKGVTNCVVGDSKIGLRPVLRVDYKGAKASGSTSKSNLIGNVNVGLIIGITFTVIGGAGLIAFFILWAKKHPSGKPPVWIIIVIAGSLLITIIGIGCFAGGISSGSGGGGSGGFKYGYYVQSSPQDSGTSGGIDYVQVGYSAWLIKSDGTASYCSSLEDSANASDFRADGYMVGTYKISGSKLTITIPERYINNFGTIGGTFTYTIKNGKLYYNGNEAYHWVRGE